jgi:hypothetical protein
LGAVEWTGPVQEPPEVGVGRSKDFIGSHPKSNKHAYLDHVLQETPRYDAVDYFGSLSALLGAL